MRGGDGTYRGAYYPGRGTYRPGAPAPSNPPPIITDASATCAGGGGSQLIHAEANKLCLFRYRFGDDSKAGGGLGAFSLWTVIPSFTFDAIEFVVPTPAFFFSIEVEAKDTDEQQAVNNPQADNFRWGPIGECP